MTRERAEELLELYQKRDAALERLAALRKSEKQRIRVEFYLDGRGRQFLLPADYIAAQWTADLYAVEREIRAAGGSL